MFRRLAQRLILPLTLIVIIVAAISGLITVRSQERQLLDAMILGADQLSRGIASATWHAMLADNREAAYSVMHTIAEKQGIDRIRIFNRDGQVMYSTAPGEAGHKKVDKRSEACSVCHSTLEPRTVVKATSRARVLQAESGHRSLAMVTPIYNEPSCSDAACHAHPKSMKVLGVLEVALSIQPVDHEVADMKVRAFAVTGIEILLISVFIYFFTRRFVTRPLEQLVEATHAMADMQLDNPIEVKGGSQEIDELAQSFSRMRRRLRESMAKLNEFAETLEAKVTERTQQLHAAQTKLMQSDRLASLGQLSASVAHEINNPVSGVLNLAMLMQRISKGRRNSPGANSGISQISGSGDRRDDAGGKNRLGSAVVLAAIEAATQPRRREPDHPLDTLAGRAQDEDGGHRDGDRTRRESARDIVRQLADSAGGLEPGDERG